MNHFVNDFRKWQKRFPCPKCNNPTLDFTLSDLIKEPLLCTHCGSYFTVDGSKK